MSKLYSAGKIGSLTIRNRLIMTPMHLGYCPDGVISDQIVEFYRSRACGGVGLIVVGAVGIDPLRVNQHAMIQIYDDRFIPGLRRLTDAVHDKGAKIFPQLWHGGRYQRPNEYNGQQPVAPSAVFSRFAGETPRELMLSEIDQIISFFASAAGRARDAGFDGIELAGSAGYLISQFLSPLTNQRTDRYGGDLQGRMTFALEVVAAVKHAVGNDFPIMMRVAGNDFMTGGHTNAEALRFCMAMEKAGINALSVTGGWHETHVPQISMQVPAGVFSYLGRAIKECVSIPVVVCNRINIRQAEESIDNGHSDFIGIARGFVADPELADKGSRRAYASVRPCIGCNQGCMDNIFYGKTLNCLCNAEAGREAELIRKGILPGPVKSSTPNRILVIGAGVAGLEYARVASLRGHTVSMWEANDQPGGQLFLAAVPPGRKDFFRLHDYLVQACRELGVFIECNRKATLKNVLEAMSANLFDKVVVATGAYPAELPVTVESDAHVVQAWDVLQRRITTGKHVVIVGGGAVGVETAMHQAEIGTLDAESLRFLMFHDAEQLEELKRLITWGSKEVTVVEMVKGIGRDIGPSTRWSMLSELKKYGVRFMDQTKVIEIKKNGVVVEKQSGRATIPADTTIIATGSRPNNQLYIELKKHIDKTSLIGDAVEPRNIQSAIRDAYDKAISF